MRALILFFPLLATLGLSFAAAVELEQIAELPEAGQKAWTDYLERSRSLALADQAALEAEVEASGLGIAIKAPEGGDFKLPDRVEAVWFASEEAQALADIVLSYQTPSGGWSKHVGYTKGTRKPGMQWTSQSDPGKRPHYQATFDNHSTTEQLSLLSRVWLATGRDDCRQAVERGVTFVLDAQYPSFGWPQVYPLEGDYHDNITFNDDAMTHVLQLMQEILGDEPAYAFLSKEVKARAKRAFETGLECVLETQIEVGGEKTVWCAQYDAISLVPSNARAMEPATLSGVESQRILKFLMSIEKPSAEVIASIESALAWFEKSAIKGLVRLKRDGKTVYEPSPESAEVYWARFYDLYTGQPVFPGRDGILYDSFAEMAKHNKIGYDYYSKLPASVLKNGQKKWRKMLSRRAQGSD